jgi:ferritin-like metal-binding protein YciE
MKSTITKMDKKSMLHQANGNSEETNVKISKGGHNVFVDELKEIYFSEKALLISIPLLIKTAATEEIADALSVHLQFTIDHIKRLEEFFNSIGESVTMSNYQVIYSATSSRKT